jgi:hypothetical protein
MQMKVLRRRRRTSTTNNNSSSSNNMRKQGQHQQQQGTKMALLMAWLPSSRQGCYPQQRWLGG